MVSDWVSEEMDTVDIGDKRLNDGLIELLSMMAASPSKSIPAAVNGGHNETTAAYRLFDNERVSFENVLEPHIDATYARLSQEKVVIVAQDTTEIDLTRPKVQVEGAGPLDGGSRFGEFLHPLIAFTPNGTPLGILSAELWTRDHGPSKADDRKKKPIEEKESVRWLDTHRHAQEIALQHPELRSYALPIARRTSLRSSNSTGSPRTIFSGSSAVAMIEASLLKIQTKQLIYTHNLQRVNRFTASEFPFGVVSQNWRAIKELEINLAFPVSVKWKFERPP